jgi:hypothetical protein
MLVLVPSLGLVVFVSLFRTAAPSEDWGRESLGSSVCMGAYAIMPVEILSPMRKITPPSLTAG